MSTAAAASTSTASPRRLNTTYKNNNDSSRLVVVVVVVVLSVTVHVTPSVACDVTLPPTDNFFGDFSAYIASTNISHPLICLDVGIYRGCEGGSHLNTSAGVASVEGAGIDATIIDCNNTGRAFFHCNGIGASLSKLTVRNGDTSYPKVWWPGQQNVHAPTSIDFSNGPIPSGGAIFIAGNDTTINITDVAFVNSTAGRIWGLYGGAVWVGEGGHVNIARCVFDGTSAFHGGAVSVFGKFSRLTISDSLFTNCYSTVGIVYTEEAPMTVVNSVFRGNSAFNTFGAHCYSAHCELHNLTISDSSALSLSAGVNVHYGSVNSTNVTISGCSGRGGGMVMIASYVPAKLSNYNVWNNTVEYGAGVAISAQSVVSLDDLHLYGNSFNDIYNSRGGVAVSSSVVAIARARLHDNFSAHGGAGLTVFFDADVSIVDSVIYNNTAGDEGGGVSVETYAKLAVTNCSIELNTAHGAGGGVHVASEARATLTNVYLAGNTAGKYGGAVYVANNESVVVLEGCNVTENWSGFEGTAVLAIDKGHVISRRSMFENHNGGNWTLSGTLSLLDGGSALFVESNITNNFKKGVYCKGGSAHFESSVVCSNQRDIGCFYGCAITGLGGSCQFNANQCGDFSCLCTIGEDNPFVEPFCPACKDEPAPPPPPPPMPVECNAIDNCGDCVVFKGCGWCSAAKECRDMSSKQACADVGGLSGLGDCEAFKPDIATVAAASVSLLTCLAIPAVCVLYRLCRPRKRKDVATEKAKEIEVEEPEAHAAVVVTGVLPGDAFATQFGAPSMSDPSLNPGGDALGGLGTVVIGGDLANAQPSPVFTGEDVPDDLRTGMPGGTTAIPHVQFDADIGDLASMMPAAPAGGYVGPHGYGAGVGPGGKVLLPGGVVPGGSGVGGGNAASMGSMGSLAGDQGFYPQQADSSYVADSMVGGGQFGGVARPNEPGAAGGAPPDEKSYSTNSSHLHSAASLSSPPPTPTGGGGLKLEPVPAGGFGGSEYDSFSSTTTDDRRRSAHLGSFDASQPPPEPVEHKPVPRITRPREPRRPRSSEPSSPSSSSQYGVKKAAPMPDPYYPSPGTTIAAAPPGGGGARHGGDEASFPTLKGTALASAGNRDSADLATVRGDRSSGVPAPPDALATQRTSTYYYGGEAGAGEAGAGEQGSLVRATGPTGGSLTRVPGAAPQSPAGGRVPGSESGTLSPATAAASFDTYRGSQLIDTTPPQNAATLETGFGDDEAAAWRGRSKLKPTRHPNSPSADIQTTREFDPLWAARSQAVTPGRSSSSTTPPPSQHGSVGSALGVGYVGPRAETTGGLMGPPPLTPPSPGRSGSSSSLSSRGVTVVIPDMRARPPSAMSSGSHGSGRAWRGASSLPTKAPADITPPSSRGPSRPTSAVSPTPSPSSPSPNTPSPSPSPHARYSPSLSPSSGLSGTGGSGGGGGGSSGSSRLGASGAGGGGMHTVFAARRSNTSSPISPSMVSPRISSAHHHQQQQQQLQQQQFARVDPAASAGSGTSALPPAPSRDLNVNNESLVDFYMTSTAAQVQRRGTPSSSDVSSNMKPSASSSSIASSLRGGADTTPPSRSSELNSR